MTRTFHHPREPTLSGSGTPDLLQRQRGHQQRCRDGGKGAEECPLPPVHAQAAARPAIVIAIMEPTGLHIFVAVAWTALAAVQLLSAYYARRHERNRAR